MLYFSIVPLIGGIQNVVELILVQQLWHTWMSNVNEIVTMLEIRNVSRLIYVFNRLANIKFVYDYSLIFCLCICLL